MTKAEIASYLVSLHSLITAQSSGAHSVPSTVLAEEYEKHWAMLKEEIAKDETGKREGRDGRPEARANLTGSESWRSGPTR